MKQEIINEIKDGLIYGLIYGLIGGLIVGLIVGLIGGLIGGLTIVFVTQLIALLTSNPELSMFSFIVSLILIILIQIIGWIIVNKLNEVKQ